MCVSGSARPALIGQPDHGEEWEMHYERKFAEAVLVITGLFGFLAMAAILTTPVSAFEENNLQNRPHVVADCTSLHTVRKQ